MLSDEKFEDFTADQKLAYWEHVYRDEFSERGVLTWEIGDYSVKYFNMENTYYNTENKSIFKSYPRIITIELTHAFEAEYAIQCHIPKDLLDGKSLEELDCEILNWWKEKFMQNN